MNHLLMTFHIGNFGKKNGKIWLTINQLAELFGIDKSGISRHIKNIFETGELQEKATVAKIATVQTEGGRNVSRSFVFILRVSKNLFL